MTRLGQLLFLQRPPTPPRSRCRCSHQRQQSLTLYKATRCSSRLPFSIQPKVRKELRENATGADAVAECPRRVPCTSAGSFQDEHLPITSADIAGSGEEPSQDRWHYRGTVI